MKKVIIISLLALLILLFIIDAVQADIYIKLRVHEGGTADFSVEITNINSSLYEEIIKNKTLNEVTIIKVINVPPEELRFNDTTHSIKFVCSVSDRVKEEIDKERMIRVIRVETEWRKFELPLTNNTSINFAKLLSPEVSMWDRTENGYIYRSTSDFGNVTFEIVGPDSAIDFYVGEDGETVIFELPLSEIDLFINSPYTILLIVVVIIFVAITYRKLRYG